MAEPVRLSELGPVQPMMGGFGEGWQAYVWSHSGWIILNAITPWRCASLEQAKSCRLCVTGTHSSHTHKT